MARTLDLVALRSFVAIAETRSVTRAAALLHLTQSAVSMQLKRLEDSLGQSLFERQRRAMILTGSGEQLLSYATRMLELNDEVWQRLTSEVFEGELVMGAPSDIVYPHVPQVLRRFASTFPRVRVSLQSSYTAPLKAALKAGTVDLILTTELEPEPRAIIVEVSPLVWIGAPHNPTAWRKRPLPLAFEQGCIFRSWVQRALDEAGIPWTMAIDSVSGRTVDASCAADLAVHVAIQSTRSPQLAVIDHEGTLPPLPDIKIALYATDGPRAALAAKLAEIVCDVWGGPCAPSQEGQVAA